MPSTSVVAARLPGGRLLIAILDPTVPDHRSPLRHHLRREAPHGGKGLEGLGNGKPSVQVTTAGEDPGEEQPGQTPIRTPR